MKNKILKFQYSNIQYFKIVKSKNWKSKKKLFEFFRRKFFIYSKMSKNQKFSNTSEVNVPMTGHLRILYQQRDIHTESYLYLSLTHGLSRNRDVARHWYVYLTWKFLDIEFSKYWNFWIFDFRILQFLVYWISKMSKFIL